MRKYLPAFLMMLFASGINAQTYSVEVKVNNVKSDDGYISVDLYNSAETFPSDEEEDVFMGKKAKACQGSTTVRFDSVPPGKYAMAILHDENDNDKMDKNCLGIPKEGDCFSENAKANFGKPKFEEADFRVRGDVYTTVFMNY
ncbi:MAG: DUF2141 domain-containing protein [Candidatus Delongbacteria bacterium]|jgi:uncharacterized protein (DUF2141 family)|nr:DUF2141 domain-containing protein [Candidatus Delongbacteria bacterium]